MVGMSPLLALFAIVVIGISIEAVERQSKEAAYALVFLVLLGIATFNAGALAQQLNGIVAALGARRKTSTSRTRPKTQPGTGR